VTPQNTLNRAAFEGTAARRVQAPRTAGQEAATQLREAGLLPAAPVRLWLRGAWQEVQLQKIEIVKGAMTPPLPGRAQDLLEEGMLALRRRDGLTAERVLTEALALAPGTLSVRNNLAAAYELQGRRAESLAIVRELHAEDPDYPFARTTLAGIAIQEGRLDEAEALLQPLLGKRRYHASEFAALAQTQISLLLARGNRAEAERLLAAWAEIDPDHPGVAEQRQRLAALAAWATASQPTVAAPVVAPPATRPLRLISRRRPGQ
jgi:tetratricopeptide (TPR) repeat protein